MRKHRWVAAVLAFATSATFVAVASGPASASSHREAPLISQDPQADNTDLYAFRDPNDRTKVDVIANYIGLEHPPGGPNFVRFGDDVLYQIHVNNTGDARDNIVYSFRFRTTVVNPNTFLFNTGRITAPNSANQNVRQSYSVFRTDGSGMHPLVVDASTPPPNIGPRSTPNYETALAAPTVTNLPGGGKVFAGVRADPFFADLGSIFDLLGLRPLNAAHKIARPASPGVNGLAGLNVHTIALQLPISEVTDDHAVPTVVDSKDSVVGFWASASRRQVRVLSDDGAAPRETGEWVQVSRLGLPLVNEVLIPLGKKDLWNATDPAHSQQFTPFVLDPEPARLIPALYPGATTPPGGLNPNGTPKRSDIVAVLTGQAAGLSAKNALPPADLLRVNLAIPAVSPGNRLGVLANDTGGFPNGRRLGDDVIDIELRLLAGGTPFTPAFNHAPNNALTDGVDHGDAALLNQFPYVGTPFDGYSHQVPGPPAP